MPEQPQLPDSQLSLNAAECAIAYREGRHEELANTFLDLLAKFRSNVYFTLDEQTTHFVNVFAKNFFFYFTQQDFNPTESQLWQFVRENVVISNVASMSAFQTTDPYVRILLAQQRNFSKVLALFNPRCETRIDRKLIFDASPTLATEWYYAYFENYRIGSVSENCRQQMREHLYADLSRLSGISGQMHHAFFGATYIDYKQDRSIKEKINEQVRIWSEQFPAIESKPVRRKACVITSMWFEGHSVYRCMRKYIEALAEDYELTLISLANSSNVTADLFTGGVRHFSLLQPHDHSAFNPSEFELAFFPDIGMNLESIVLSNLRIAPVQVCGYGHPVSTRGAQIDYWLGGIETEDKDSAVENYSERLVLIPGAGVMPNKPTCLRQGNHQPSSIVRVNCSWSGQKINFQNLSILRRIAEGAQAPMHFRFFPGGSVMAGAYIPLQTEIGQVLGDSAGYQVFGTLGYDQYMAIMEDAEFTLDPFPFGGYATATDALFLGKPIVAMKGTKFYNRSAASLLYRCGLDELVTNDEDSYVETAIRLVDDAAFRQDIVARIEGHDLDQTIFADDSSRQFKAAMNYLVKHHDKLSTSVDRSPLVFE